VSKFSRVCLESVGCLFEIILIEGDSKLVGRSQAILKNILVCSNSNFFFKKGR